MRLFFASLKRCARYWNSSTRQKSRSTAPSVEVGTEMSVGILICSRVRMASESELVESVSPYNEDVMIGGDAWSSERAYLVSSEGGYLLVTRARDFAVALQWQM
jgi:hypothetical protein